MTVGVPLDDGLMTSAALSIRHVSRIQRSSLRHKLITGSSRVLMYPRLCVESQRRRTMGP
jgi:hypothetical protein